MHFRFELANHCFVYFRGKVMKTIKNLARLFLVCLAVLGLWLGGMQSVNAEDTDVSAVMCESKGQYLPNPEDKHSFYQCAPADEDGGLRAVLHQCPMESAIIRLVFNPELNVCDYDLN
jgi:hypothetical protein